MAAYVVQADLEAYVEGWVTDDAASLGRLLERASRDVDWYVGSDFPVVNASTGARFDFAVTDPTVAGYLSASAQFYVKRAVCAQAEYRAAMGEEFMVKAQYEFVAGPDFQMRGRLDTFSPKAVRELEQAGVIRETIAL